MTKKREVNKNQHKGHYLCYETGGPYSYLQIPASGSHSKSSSGRTSHLHWAVHDLMKNAAPTRWQFPVGAGKGSS